MERNKQLQRLQTLRATVKKWLLVTDMQPLDAVLSTVIANRMNSDPLWLFLIGPPSSAKTELIQPLKQLEYVYPLSSLTPQTFASGYVGKEESLLNKLKRNDILTFKDFTSILTMHRDNRGAILGQLREIYDGHYRKTFGTGGDVNWSGKLGFIAGVTPIIDTHYAVFNTLGERFIQVRMRPVNEIQVARKAMRNNGREGDMRAEIATAMKQFLAGTTIPNIEEIELPKALETQLANLAAFTVKARSAIMRDGRTREVGYIPDAEAPPRFAKQLLLLAQASPILRAATRVGSQEMRLVLRAALDCLPADRLKVVKMLCRNRTPLSISELARMLHMPIPTTDRVLEELTCHGVVASDKAGRERLCRLSDWSRMRLRGFFSEVSRGMQSATPCY